MGSFETVLLSSFPSSFRQIPSEYPLRPSLVSLADDKLDDADVAGEASAKEELCAVANEVR